MTYREISDTHPSVTAARSGSGSSCSSSNDVEGFSLPLSGVSGAREPSQPWVCTRPKRGGSPRETAISYPTEKTLAGIGKGKGPTSSARPCVGRGPLRAPLSPIQMEMPKGLLKMWVGPPECTAGVSKQQFTGQIQMHLSLKMKLYWNTTMPFHPQVVHGCFCSMAQS